MSWKLHLVAFDLEEKRKSLAHCEGCKLPLLFSCIPPTAPATSQPCAEQALLGGTQGLDPVCVREASVVSRFSTQHG